MRALPPPLHRAHHAGRGPLEDRYRFSLDVGPVAGGWAGPEGRGAGMYQHGKGVG